MKKKILMIGNTNNLLGVSVDVSAYYSFFTSPAGGNWYDEEIDILPNPTRYDLLDTINEMRGADYDYVITVFAGHGNEAGSGTVLAINGQGETIEIDDLLDLSQRQLLIFDCCRSYADTDCTVSGATMLSMSRDPIRQTYEDRIENSAPQEVILFACDEGEKAMGTDDGGEYSQHLLYATHMILAHSDSPFVSVSKAHYKAVSLMTRENPFTRQHPQILQTRCLPYQRLPLAVNPYYW